MGKKGRRQVQLRKIEVLKKEDYAILNAMCSVNVQNKL